MRYIPNSPEERQEMLRGLGLGSAEELFDSIPSDIILKEPLKTPPALSEIELLERFEAMAAKTAAEPRLGYMTVLVYGHEEHVA